MTVSGREKKGHQHGRLLLQLEVAWAAACYVALFVLCSLCYSNSLYGELVHDDVWAIVNNPDVRPGSSLRNIFRNDFWGKRMADNTSHKSYRPLCILTFKLNILLGGMTPLYFHIINVCLHCAVTCLLMYTCERCVFENPYLAFITALLFAVHPVHTEAVSGIVGRSDVLACLLFLLTFHLYIRSIDEWVSEDSFPSTVSPGSLLISLFLGTCAMLVKETGITVFGVCLLYDALVLCRKPLTHHLLSSRLKDFPHFCTPFIKRACFISGYVVLIMSVRLWLMGGSMPLFSEQDNPASFSPHLLTSCTAAERTRLQRVRHTTQRLIGCPLSFLEKMHRTCCLQRAWSIIKDPSHPSHHLYKLLPSGRRFRPIKSRTNRLKTVSTQELLLL